MTPTKKCGFSAPIVTKSTVVQINSLSITCSDVLKIGRSVKNMVRISFTPLGKVRILLHWFSQKFQFLYGIVGRSPVSNFTKSDRNLFGPFSEICLLLSRLSLNSRLLTTFLKYNPIPYFINIWHGSVVAMRLGYWRTDGRGLHIKRFCVIKNA